MEDKQEYEMAHISLNHPWPGLKYGIAKREDGYRILGFDGENWCDSSHLIPSEWIARNPNKIKPNDLDRLFTFTNNAVFVPLEDVTEIYELIRQNKAAEKSPQPRAMCPRCHTTGYEPNAKGLTKCTRCNGLGVLSSDNSHN